MEVRFRILANIKDIDPRTRSKCGKLRSPNAGFRIRNESEPCAVSTDPNLGFRAAQHAPTNVKNRFFNLGSRSKWRRCKTWQFAVPDPWGKRLHDKKCGMSYLGLRGTGWRFLWKRRGEQSSPDAFDL